MFVKWSLSFMVYSAWNKTVPTHDTVRKSHGAQDIDVTLFWFLSDTQVPFSQWRGTTGHLFVSVLGFHMRGSGGAGYTEWDLNVCLALHVTSRYLSLSLPLSHCPAHHNSTHTLASAAPLQLTAWYPETWTLGWATQGKHQMLKKTGTCTAKNHATKTCFK